MEYSVDTCVTFEVVTRKRVPTFKCLTGKISSLQSKRPLTYTTSFRFHPQDVFDTTYYPPPFQFLLVTRNKKTLHICLMTGQQHNQFVTHMSFATSPDEVRALTKIAGSSEDDIRNRRSDIFPDPLALLYPQATTIDSKLFMEGDIVSMYW
jgi:hypothetical protein